MIVRARRPTDEDGTEVYDPERRRAPGGASAVALAAPKSWDHDATEVTPWPGQPPVEQAMPTQFDPSRPSGAIEQGTPTELTARPERTGPIRVISMKDRTEGDRPRGDAPRIPLHVQLRSMAEVSGIYSRSTGLGRLAPPHDPQKACRRRRRDNAVWACVALLLACGISLAIWLVAGR